MKDCECIFAEELVSLELLSCSDAKKCPNSCPICSACMQLMGCTQVTTGISSDRTSNTLYVVAATIGLLVFGMVYFVARRNREQGELGAHLMENEEMGTSVPPSPPLLPPTGPSTSSGEPNVWLAPDMEPTQFEPSARAAARSNGFPEPMSILSSRPTFSTTPQDQVWLAPVT